MGRNAKCLRSAAGVPFVPVAIEAWSSWAVRWSDPDSHGADIDPQPGAGDTLLLTAHPEDDGKRGFYWCPSAGVAGADCLRTDGQVRTVQQDFRPGLSIGLLRDKIGRNPALLAPILA